MITKKPMRQVLILNLVCIAAFLFSFSACSHNAPDTEPEVITIHALWPSYSLEQAISRSSTIVYGKVVSKGETLTHESQLSNGDILTEYYRNVSIEVIDLIKGENDLDFVEYKEMGGVVGSVTYQYEGLKFAESGEHILLFLNENNVAISASGVMILDSENKISVAKAMIPNDVSPAAYGAETNSLRVNVPIEDYCALIKSSLQSAP